MSLEEKILNRLIDKYERSKLYLSGSSNQKSIFILTSKDKLFDAYFSPSGYQVKDDYDKALLNLKERQYIEIRYDGDIPKKIILSLNNLDDIYKTLKREPIKETNLKEINKLEDLLNKYKNNEVLRAYLSDIIGKLENYKVHKSSLEVFKKVQENVRCIDAIMSNKEDVLLRNLSVKALGDSKQLESGSDDILKIYNLYSENKFENFDDLLSNFNISRNLGFIYLKGDITLKIKDQIVVVKNLGSVFALPTNMIKYTTILNIGVAELLTIENLTTFNYFTNDDYLSIYTGGYPKRSLIGFLKLFKKYSGLKFFHYGDIDYGGFSIYLTLVKQSGINFIPFRMDIDTLKANLALTKHLTEHDKTNLSLLSKKVNNPKIKETIDYMILNNIKLEQESID